MNRRIPALAALALSGALVLSACTPSAPVETKTPTAATKSATPSPTPTVKTAPTQKPIAAPKTEEEAIRDANAAYKEYLTVWFDFLKDPKLTQEYLVGYITTNGGQARLARDTYDRKIDAKTSVSGEPFEWTLNPALSYTAATTDLKTGKKNLLGAVHLVGCSDNTSVTFFKDGAENTNIAKGSSPFSVDLVYSPKAEAWLIADSDSLAGDDGAPLC